MTVRPDPELEHIKELLLILAGNNEAIVTAAIDEVMAEHGEVVLEAVVQKISEKVSEPQGRYIRDAREALTA